MSLHAGWRWGRLLAGAGLPLPAAVLAAPPAARASCGDYVLIGSRVVHLAGQPQIPGATDRPDSLPADPDPEPCSGPMCNGRVPLPVTIPVTVPPSQTEDGLCLSAHVLPGDARLAGFLGDEPTACPEGPGLSVYRPPRPHLV
jgi:hypothetical protein